MKNSEAGKTFIEYVLVLAIFAFLCWIVVSSLSIGNLQATVAELEEGKPIGLFMQIPSSELPEQVRKDNPNAVMVKYYSLTGDKVQIPANGWGMITEDKKNSRDCGQLIGAAPFYRGFQPKVGAMESGAKVYLMTIGITGIGSKGCETGSIIYNKDYSATFSPDDTQTKIWNMPNCIMRIWTGHQYTQSSCMEGGWMPTQNFVRNAPIPNDNSSGMYIVFAYATGAWVHGVDAGELPTVFGVYQVDQQTQSGITNYMNKFKEMIGQ